MTAVLILALDTTTPAGSIALARGPTLVAARAGDSRATHGERLPGEIQQFLRAHGFDLADVDLYAVNVGPGSFTGLRVGVATVQGLALVGGRKLVAVSGFDALAYLASLAASTERDGHLAAGWIDAQRGEVFAALYRLHPAASEEPFVVLDPPAVEAPERVVARWSGVTRTARRVWGVGDGIVRHRGVFERLPNAHIPDDVPPVAGAVARLAWQRAERGETIEPNQVKPLYVRRPDAELARERHRRVPDPHVSR